MAETRDPQSPLKSARGSAVALGQGGLGYMIASALGASAEIAILIGGLWTALASVLGPWARDMSHKDPSALLYKILSMAGVAVLAIGLSGCTAKFGPGKYGWASWNVENRMNFELTTGLGILCIGCLETELEDPNAE